MGQGAEHQGPALPGEGEGGNARLRPQQGEEGEGQGDTPPLQGVGKAAVQKAVPGKLSRAGNGKVPGQPAQEGVGRQPQQGPGQGPAGGLPPVVKQHGNTSSQSPRASLILLTYRRDA